MRRKLLGALALAAVAATAGCAVSTQQEVQLGAQEAQQVQAQLPMLNDPYIDNYVSSLGMRLARATSRNDLDWHFAVVNSDVVNAFALPGGYVYVNRGVLERADRMDELAGVLGHEISHVVLRHSVKQMEQAQGANVGVSLLCVLTRVCESGVGQAAIQVGGTAVFAKFSRADEQQADEEGFRTLIRAGINPEGLGSFFQKLLAEEQRSGDGANGVAAWFSDHPGTSDRIADMQRMMSGMSQSQLASLATNDPNFATMKRRLAALPPAPPPRRTQ